MSGHSCDAGRDGKRSLVPTLARSVRTEIVAILGLVALALLSPGLGSPAAATDLQQAEAPAAAIAPPAVDATAETDEVAYSYDEAGRLVRADYGDMVISYSYDPAGNLVEMVQSPAGGTVGASAPSGEGGAGEPDAAT